MNFYILDYNEESTPWGDYGHILVHGMSDRPYNSNKTLKLERTGPFVPPITFPSYSDIVVTDEFKILLESSGLSGFMFKPIIKKHIVLIDWDKWDLKATEPKKLPSGCEPENYIEKRKHNEKVAEEIGKLWELCIKEGPIIQDKCIVLSSWNGQDFFSRGGFHKVCYVSEKAKLWLEETVNKWVSFKPVLTR